MGSSINFSDIKCTQLTEDEASFYRRQVANLLNRSSSNFPGAQPVSFARRHLDELQRDDYYVCEKTDGIRCLLYLTHYIDPVEGDCELQLLINRKNEYYAIQKGYLHLPPPGPNNQQPFDVERWHIGTLLDGELVLERPRDRSPHINYLIFDLLALDGESVMTRDYSVRIGKLSQQVFKPWKAFAAAWPQDAQAQPFQLKMKEWQLSYHMPHLFENVIPNLTHGNDGLIFTCKNTPYVAGTDQHILKWKPPHENTVDFRIHLDDGYFPLEEDDEGLYEDFDQKPRLDLMAYHGKRGGSSQYEEYGRLEITDREWEAFKGAKRKLDQSIIECFQKDRAWRPKLEEDGSPRFRDDKDHANHISVVKSVIESINDAVSEEDLRQNSPKIRTAWKEREKRASSRDKPK